MKYICDYMAKSSFSPKNSTVGFSLFMYILLAECRQTNEQVRNNDSKNNTPYSTIGLSCLLTLLQNCLLYSHGCSQIFCFQIQRPAKNYLPQRARGARYGTTMERGTSTSTAGLRLSQTSPDTSHHRNISMAEVILQSIITIIYR
jgi:hypothetical protein